MSTRQGTAFLLAFGRVDCLGAAPVITSQDGGILSISSVSQTDFTLVLVEPFDGAAVEVVATPETVGTAPAPQTCAVIVDGAASSVRVVADRGTAAVRVSVRGVVGAA